MLKTYDALLKLSFEFQQRKKNPRSEKWNKCEHQNGKHERVLPLPKQGEESEDSRRPVLLGKRTSVLLSKSHTHTYTPPCRVLWVLSIPINQFNQDFATLHFLIWVFMPAKVFYIKPKACHFAPPTSTCLSKVMDISNSIAKEVQT